MKSVLNILMTATVAFVIIACGGGGGDGSGDTNPITPEAIEAVEESISLVSESVGVTYRISVGLPPAYDELGSPHPAIFLLDGDWFFNDFFSGLDENDDFILIGINNSDRRNIDYLPPNNCEAESGGSDAFLDFLVSELVPYLDATYNIDPALRLLFGHSHGGSFVFFTLFADHGQTFPLLFANDASLQCWAASAMEQAYAFENDTLPVAFYATGATEGNADVVGPVMDAIVRHDYAGLAVKYDRIIGTHDGILDTAFSTGFDWLGSQVEGLPD